MILVSLSGSLAITGLYMGLPAALIQEWLGSRVLSGISSVLAALVWTLLYLTVKYPDTLSQDPVLIGFYFFIAGKEF